NVVAVTQYPHTRMGQQRTEFFLVGRQKSSRDQESAVLRSWRPKPRLQGIMYAFPHRAHADKQHGQSALGIPWFMAGIVDFFVESVNVPDQLFLGISLGKKRFGSEVARTEQAVRQIIFFFFDPQLLFVEGVFVIR